MSLIEKLLEFTEKQSKSVVVALFGIIVAGSIGGGLWIKSLLSTIEYKDSYISERLTLAEERYHSKYLGLKKENLILTEQITILRSHLPKVNESIILIDKYLTANNISNKDFIYIEINKLKDMSIKIDESLSKSDEISKLSHEIAIAKPEPSGAKPPNSIYLLLFGSVVVIFISVFLIVYSFYRLYQRRRSNESRE
ncbi:MAG: hypothetical protein OMM_06018 [Candidatus Magnetoglobus multicellularis str. Araruama]|uniref:Uncharacterized protein n=1 Tax=Candidatus Magnetoglobus multicellularis str. Araruama TaxID=890399 RepID=A0A1V1NSR5_9BACT|nr:MAG: hypothetical protein OMM_06018 [Candidatus Magnetoglobus multicellularis str. Araruama]